MGVLADLAGNLRTMSDNMVTRADPQYGVVNNDLKNQAQTRSVLQDMAAQQQQNQQKGQSGQVDQTGNAIPTQQLPPSFAAYQALQNRLAQANPGNAAMVNNAAAAQSPYYSQMQAMNAQQAQAQVAATKTDAIKPVTDAAGNTHIINLNNGTVTPLGVQTGSTTPEGKKIEDLTNLAHNPKVQAAAGIALPAIPGGNQGGAQGTNSGGTNIGVPNGGVATGVQGMIQEGLMSDTQRQVMKQRQDDINESQQQLAQLKAAADPALKLYDAQDQVLNDPNLPTFMPNEQAAASNALHGIGLGNAGAANAVSNWDKYAAKGNVGAIENFAKSASNAKLNMTVDRNIKAAQGTPLTGSVQNLKSQVNANRNEIYNSLIEKQNEINLKQNPNGAVQIPALPMDFRGKLHSLSDVQAGAAKYGIPVQEAIKKVYAAGGGVLP